MIKNNKCRIVKGSQKSYPKCCPKKKCGGKKKKNKKRSRKNKKSKKKWKQSRKGQAGGDGRMTESPEKVENKVEKTPGSDYSQLSDTKLEPEKEWDYLVEDATADLDQVIKTKVIDGHKYYTVKADI